MGAVVGGGGGVVSFFPYKWFYLEINNNTKIVFYTCLWMEHRGDGPDTHKVTKKEEEIELV